MSKSTKPLSAPPYFQWPNYPKERAWSVNLRVHSPPPVLIDLPPARCLSWCFALKPGDNSRIRPSVSSLPRKTDSEMSRGCVHRYGANALALSLPAGPDQDKRKSGFWYGLVPCVKPSSSKIRTTGAKKRRTFECTWPLSDPLPLKTTGLAPRFPTTCCMEENYLKDHPARRIAEFYMFGPPMIKRVGDQYAAGHGVEPENISLMILALRVFLRAISPYRVALQPP